LLNTIGFPCLIVAIETRIELNVVLDVSERPQLLRSVAWEVVGDELVEGGSGGALELGSGALGGSQSDCAGDNQK